MKRIINKKRNVEAWDSKFQGESTKGCKRTCNYQEVVLSCQQMSGCMKLMPWQNIHS